MLKRFVGISSWVLRCFCSLQSTWRSAVTTWLRTFGLLVLMLRLQSIERLGAENLLLFENLRVRPTASLRALLDTNLVVWVVMTVWSIQGMATIFCGPFRLRPWWFVCEEFGFKSAFLSSLSLLILPGWVYLPLPVCHPNLISLEDWQIFKPAAALTSLQMRRTASAS